MSFLRAVQAPRASCAAVPERWVPRHAPRVGERERRAPSLGVGVLDVAPDVGEGRLRRGTRRRARRGGARAARGLEQTHGRGGGHGRRRRAGGIRRRVEALAVALQQTDHLLCLFSRQVVALLQRVQQVRRAGCALGRTGHLRSGLRGGTSREGNGERVRFGGGFASSGRKSRDVDRRRLGLQSDGWGARRGEWRAESLLRRTSDAAGAADGIAAEGPASFSAFGDPRNPRTCAGREAW